MLFKGYNTSYLDTGEVFSGKTVLLVHGFGASSEYWRALYPELSKEYRLVAIDLLGYGYSEKPKDVPMSI